jgi:hypothetical protein
LTVGEDSDVPGDGEDNGIGELTMVASAIGDRRVGQDEELDGDESSAVCPLTAGAAIEPDQSSGDFPDDGAESTRSRCSNDDRARSLGWTCTEFDFNRGDDGEVVPEDRDDEPNIGLFELEALELPLVLDSSGD